MAQELPVSVDILLPSRRAGAAASIVVDGGPFVGYVWQAGGGGNWTNITVATNRRYTLARGAFSNDRPYLRAGVVAGGRTVFSPSINLNTPTQQPQTLQVEKTANYFRINGADLLQDSNNATRSNSTVNYSYAWYGGGNLRVTSAANFDSFATLGRARYKPSARALRAHYAGGAVSVQLTYTDDLGFVTRYDLQAPKLGFFNICLARQPTPSDCSAGSIVPRNQAAIRTELYIPPHNPSVQLKRIIWENTQQDSFAYVTATMETLNNVAFGGMTTFFYHVPRNFFNRQATVYVRAIVEALDPNGNTIVYTSESFFPRTFFAYGTLQISGRGTTVRAVYTADISELRNAAGQPTNDRRVIGDSVLKYQWQTGSPTVSRHLAKHCRGNAFAL